MCIHKRILFSCNHYTFAQQVRPCEIEAAFLTGHLSMPCDTIVAHPLHSLSVQRCCNTCEKKKAKFDRTAAKLKTALSEIKQKLEQVSLNDLKKQVGRLEKDYELLNWEELDVVQESDPKRP
jgi:hypothetical protein